MSKNKLYYIYHIIGKKVGCTMDIKRRMKQQGTKEGDYEVLLCTNSLKRATKREQEYQIKLGYPVDNINYTKVLNNLKKAYTPQAQAKRVAKIDYKARVANMDYKAKAEKCKKPILQLDKQGNFIKEWDSAKTAGNTLCIHKGGITRCCKEQLKSCKGYVWKYK